MDDIIFEGLWASRHRTILSFFLKGMVKIGRFYFQKGGMVSAQSLIFIFWGIKFLETSSIGGCGH